MGTKRRYHKYNNSATVQREDKVSGRQRNEHGQLFWRISVEPHITRNLSPTPKQACKGWTTLPRNRCFHSDVTHEKYVFEGKEYSLLDIDLTPLINPNVKKEDISCTCKKADGHAMPSASISGRISALRKGCSRVPRQLKQICSRKSPSRSQMSSCELIQDMMLLIVSSSAPDIIRRNLRGADQMISLQPRKRSTPLLSNDFRFLMDSLVKMDEKPAKAPTQRLCALYRQGSHYR